ncbi:MULTISPECIES: type II secretion system protein N [Acinetobacter]|uniref:General secretion pathway protein n=1 Tax=Acinetobacter haemolyticus TaxID=29430 RepID=A0A1L6KR41_ACIHA|nr:type II secretion system protein N [Acinetobacter haemolyticus]APR71548.1 general secretion pathway protein [Acinetobacter haemolyticus]ATZ68391.1 general secretion pathway protein [Acinetobacter haemolyticus]ENW22682.1 type II secretion system protein C [Acinetobacter haemolyticus NIPH 261]MCU4388037.1 general secretion pathway protein [Acinetobacter haemolyticus]NAR35477.1 general secretion pathway protein [Acinetobacter haemolyticus]
MDVLIQKIQRLDWQKLDKLSPLILAILLLWLCWKLASFFWLVVAPPQAMQFDRVELGSQQAQVPNISSFALFNEPAASTVQDNVNLELQGVLLGSSNSLSSAVIKLNDSAEHYRVGETLGSTSYQLVEVYWDRVVLKQGNGATREVTFKGLEKGLYQPIEPINNRNNQPPPAHMPEPVQNSPQSALGQAIQQMQDNREQYLKNMGVSGGADGYEITDQTPVGLKNTLGLRAGDRVLSINGQTVGQGLSEVQLLEQVRRQGHAKIEIKRGDQVMTIQQSF